MLGGFCMLVQMDKPGEVCVILPACAGTLTCYGLPPFLPLWLSVCCCMQLDNFCHVVAGPQAAKEWGGVQHAVACCCPHKEMLTERPCLLSR